MDAWLEITPCPNEDLGVNLDPSLVRGIPALSKAFAAAGLASLKKAEHSLAWEYSQRLSCEEVDSIKEVLKFETAREDSRSIVHESEVKYDQGRYTLRLFIEKSQ